MTAFGVRSRHKFGVVPAKAGIHNHQNLLMCDAGATARFNYATLWLWVPGQARDDNAVRAET
ncbi:hypothetical protein UP09_10565 [Bradyrhizobium sp. LTSP885]|nr:hypothetical protein UP09_10565 [Bradyrhizobium sp. LTSP885]